MKNPGHTGKTNSPAKRASGRDSPAGGNGAAFAPPAYGIDFLDSATQAAAPNSTGMPDGLKSGIESMSGMDLSDVRVNFNSERPAGLEAAAYTQGNEIYLAPGQEKHLPHEAWHVVQQRQGRVKPTIKLKDARINDDAGLENEADVMGALAQAKPEPAAGVVQEKGRQARPDSFAPSKDGIVQRTKWYWNAPKHEWLPVDGSKPPYSPKPHWNGKWHETADTSNEEKTGNQKNKKDQSKDAKEDEGSTVHVVKAHKAKRKEKRKAEKKAEAAKRGVYGKLLELKQNNEHEFIRGLLGDFDVDGWHFPAQTSGDGIMGKNTISASRSVEVDKAGRKLALHINFMIGAGSLTEAGGAVSAQLNLALLHVTARSANSQVQIVDNGASILTATKSIHCGPNNDWNWNDNKNVGELLTEIAGELEALKAAVGKFGKDYIANLRAALQAKLKERAQAEGVTLTLEGDKTWS